MIEQVVNMKKRYRALVEKFSQGDFDAYFAEFFLRYPMVTYVSWVQTEQLIEHELFILSPAYLARYPDLEEGVLVEEGMVVLKEVTKEHKKYELLYEAVEDILKLCECRDVLEHVFGKDHYVSAEPGKIVSEPWEDVFGVKSTD